MADDLELVARWQQGDRAAAEQLFERHFDSIYRFFASKVRGGVEDLVQETFLACVTGRERFAAANSFRAFLLGTARNILFTHYRKLGRAPLVDDIGDSRLIDLEPGASSVLAQRDEERLVLEALRRLSLSHQITLELYYWEDLTGPEVAEALGVSLTAMRSRLHRAKQELQRQLEHMNEPGTLLESTITDLDAWARALRDRVQTQSET